MVQETFLSAFQIPQAFMPAASAAAPPTLPSALTYAHLQQQQQTTAALLQLQPYLAMLLAAANKDRDQMLLQPTRLEQPSPIEGDIIKPIPVMPHFAIAAAHHTVPLVTSPATFPTQHTISHTTMDTVAAPMSPAKGGSTASRNKLGRSYNPGRPLAMEDRKKILDLYEQGHKISHIARQIGVTHSCVSKIMSRFRRTGSMQPRSFAAAQQPVQQLQQLQQPAAGLALGPLAHAQLLAQLQQAAVYQGMDLTRLQRDDDTSSDSEHISVDDGETTSKCDSPLSRLSISPSSAFSPPVRKNSPTYSIESILNQ